MYLFVLFIIQSRYFSFAKLNFASTYHRFLVYNNCYCYLCICNLVQFFVDVVVKVIRYFHGGSPCFQLTFRYLSCANTFLLATL